MVYVEGWLGGVHAVLIVVCRVCGSMTVWGMLSVIVAWIRGGGRAER